MSIVFRMVILSFILLLGACSSFRFDDSKAFITTASFSSQEQIPITAVRILVEPTPQLPIIAPLSIDLPEPIPNIVENILFDSDSSALSSTAISQLDHFATSVAKGDYQILVEGHTDSSNTHEYNLSLSEARTATVKNGLIARGIPEQRLVVDFHGETKAVASNEDAYGKQQNRRVELRPIQPTESAINTGLKPLSASSTPVVIDVHTDDPETFAVQTTSVNTPIPEGLDSSTSVQTVPVNSSIPKGLDSSTSVQTTSINPPIQQVSSSSSSTTTKQPKGIPTGIDVSHYQGVINWDRQKHLHYAFAKATGGTSFVDSKLEHNLSGMKESSLIRGVYHFFYPSHDAKTQAEHFLSNASKFMGEHDLPPVLDIEIDEKKSAAEIRKGVRTWLDIVEKALNCKPIVYTNRPFADKYLGDEFADYHLWIAEYTTRSTPKLPKAWKTWTFWQYSDKSHVIHNTSKTMNVDGNRFNGRKPDLEAYIQDNPCQWQQTDAPKTTSTQTTSVNPPIQQVSSSSSSTTTKQPKGIPTGIDVSHYQGLINWDRQKHLHYAFAKATGGTSFIDSKLEHNLSGMKESSLIRGVYHFFYPSHDAKTQAEHFLSNASKFMDEHDLPPVLDIEIDEKKSAAEIRKGVRTWLDIVEKALNCKPIVYTNRPFADKYLGDEFADHHLWIAEYTTRSTPKLPKAWKTWTFWQYSDKSHVIHNTSKTMNVDGNRFNGRKPDLEAYIQDNPCQWSQIS